MDDPKGLALPTWVPFSPYVQLQSKARIPLGAVSSSLKREGAGSVL